MIAPQIPTGGHTDAGAMREKDVEMPLLVRAAEEDETARRAAAAGRHVYVITADHYLVTYDEKGRSEPRRLNRAERRRGKIPKVPDGAPSLEHFDAVWRAQTAEAAA